MLNEVKPLWQKLNSFLLTCSGDFKQHYRSMTFEKRTQELLKKTAKGEIRITLAMDKDTGDKVGYCISIMNEVDRTGEIESIFVETGYRGKGIGDSLVLDALTWMGAKGAETKLVSFSAGNESVFKFYHRYGFKQRRIVMEQV